MVIRGEQIRALDAHAENSFKSLLAAYLREWHGQSTVRLPDRTFTIRDMPDAILAALVDVGIERAHSHVLTWQSSLAAFVTLMVTVAPNFDQQPAILAALAPDHRPPNFRMAELAQSVTQQDWDVAATAYDKASWHTGPHKT